MAERIALVTGAHTGIGWAVAQRLAHDGFALAFHTRDESDDARARFEEIAAAARAHWLVGDLSDPAAPEQLVEEAVSALGQLDVLVNNAGISVAKRVLDVTSEDFDAIFAVDVRGALLLSTAAAKRMREAGGGVIVNVTSVHEHMPRVGFAVYASAKAALGMLTRSLALELGPDGIRVNAVAPGAIATERNAEAAAVSRDAPLRRPGQPEEVAALVSYLVGDGAGYVTGASILVDGGLAQALAEPPAA
jgi:NAD(P)-dependent dehydrogenase (short-subunit alcohol dehydrogenase family)